MKISCFLSQKNCWLVVTFYEFLERKRNLDFLSGICISVGNLFLAFTYVILDISENCLFVIKSPLKCKFFWTFCKLLIPFFRKADIILNSILFSFIMYTRMQEFSKALSRKSLMNFPSFC